MQSGRRGCGLAVSCSAILASLPVLAQSPQPSTTDDFLRRQAGEALELRLTTARDATPDGVRLKGDTLQPYTATTGGACFPVNRVTIEGASLLSPRTLQAVLMPYEHKCIGLGDINSLLKAVTNLYLEEGYITSRVYVPEQNIAEARELRLVAIEGTLSDIYVNGAPATHPGLAATAFPGMKGGPANIRDIEQGLDQINRLSSSNARSVMLPGETPGSSILNIENQPARPWHLSLANDNLGQRQTGYSRSSVSLRMDNLASLNDLATLTYEHTGPDYPWPEDGVGRSDSIAGSVSVPYGYWTFSLDGSWYKYQSTVPGNFGDLESSGDSRQAGLRVDRVVSRDKNSITTLRAGLTYKETNNFLMGSRIEVGSRRYTVAELGLSHSRRMLSGVWVLDLTYSQGVDLFGAVERGDPGAGGAEPHFSKFTGTASVTRPLELAEQHFELSSIVNGQYAPDNLFGAEQISLGSYSNVRGARDGVLFGNNGFFLRNEIIWRTMPWSESTYLANGLGELRPYAAIDYGHVFGQDRFGIEGGDLASWTVGARLAGGSINADLGYSRVFESSTDTASRELFFINASLQW
ncbi:ShlB/FhaC/HecB family hemolysin secretion/activation protein [Ciceribacter sp. RN22]|uniref:ShlB/FhaC/HecB family hemolysin secretion/activation protein n=1 Tax=Ciceribacter sp. RN22 TaxID=2954932 RepID=UPI00209284A1|nr:ShlB/FhaC/HecB family hemolysin secretion/activation protein [Ciceribacter sp. RN22]MCO6181118.1 ShlB/FhaC/HecB family hemolysin secretion/activation protein [Ciceribacter sp. RN22]